MVQKVITVYWALLCDILTINKTNLLIILHVDVRVNTFCFVSPFTKKKHVMVLELNKPSLKSIHRLSCSKTVAPTLLNYLLNMLHEIHHSYLRGKHNAGVMLFSFIAQYRLSIYQCRIKITVRELRINLQFYWPLICDIYNIKQYFLFFNSTEKRHFQKLFSIDFKSLKNCNYRSDENLSSAKC